jgi:hypothetical protein
MAQRWFVCAAQADTLQPCVGLRLRECANLRCRSLRILNLIDESTRECLMIPAERRWSSAKVIGALADVMVWEGVPGAHAFRRRSGVRREGPAQWLADAGARRCISTPVSLGERPL